VVLQIAPSDLLFSAVTEVGFVVYYIEDLPFRGFSKSVHTTCEKQMKMPLGISVLIVEF
jgi:hypothetical protein